MYDANNIIRVIKYDKSFGATMKAKQKPHISQSKLKEVYENYV
jgi:hypothetical protein